MITKNIECTLSKEEVSSPEDIKIVLSIKIEGEEGQVDYIIDYPKGIPKELPSLDEVRSFLQTDEECKKILNKKGG